MGPVVLQDQAGELHQVPQGAFVLDLFASEVKGFQLRQPVQESEVDSATGLDVEFPQVGELQQVIGAEVVGGVVDVEVGDAGQVGGRQGAVVIGEHVRPMEIHGKFRSLVQGIDDV